MAFPQTNQEKSQRRTLEAVVVIACLGTTIAMALPQVIPVMRTIESRATADDATAFVIAARRQATVRGVCVQVKADQDERGQGRMTATVATDCRVTTANAASGEKVMEPFIAPTPQTTFFGRPFVFASTGEVLKRGVAIEVADERISPRRRELLVQADGRICLRNQTSRISESREILCDHEGVQHKKTFAIGCSQGTLAHQPSAIMWWAVFFAAVATFVGVLRRKAGPRLQSRRAPSSPVSRSIRGYMLIEVSVAALVLVTVVGLAFAYTGRVRAGQQRQELARVAMELAHVEADRISGQKDVAQLKPSEDAMAADRRMIRSVDFRRMRPDGAPSDEGALIEVRVRVKYPTPAGPKFVSARRVVRVR